MKVHVVADMNDAFRRSALIARLGVLLLCFTVWLVSVWLFFIQPMAGKLILPKFGGEPAVWTTAMVAFSLASVFGLLFAWLLSTFRRKRWALRVITAGFLLVVIDYLANFSFLEQASLFMSPVFMSLLPFCAAMILLFILQVILPYWFGQAAVPAWVDPYFVLAFAHLGAMMSIIGYPFFVERWMPLTYQRSFWLIGFALIGLLFLVCTSLLVMASRAATMTSQLGGVAGDHPTWLRRFRWAVLGGLPTVLMAYTPPLPDAAAFPLVVYILPLILELTLVIAYVRLPKGKPSLLSLGVQIVALLTCLPFVLAMAGVVSEPGSRWIYVLLLGVVASALIPHRWTILMQGVAFFMVVFLQTLGIDTPLAGTYVVRLTVFAVTSWGCYGDILSDRPGPERLPEFLFFTGLAPSIVFSFVPTAVELLTPQIAYPGIVLLAFFARFLPGKSTPMPQQQEEKWAFGVADDGAQPILDTSIREAE